MADSILNVGKGAILGPLPADDPAAQMEAALLRAGVSDWRAALAWLQNSPDSREEWSEAAKFMAICKANTGAFIRGIDRWQKAENIDPQVVRNLILSIKAAGVIGVDDDEDE